MKVCIQYVQVCISMYKYLLVTHCQSWGVNKVAMATTRHTTWDKQIALRRALLWSSEAQHTMYHIIIYTTLDRKGWHQKEPEYGHIWPCTCPLQLDHAYGKSQCVLYMEGRSGLWKTWLGPKMVEEHQNTAFLTVQRIPAVPLLCQESCSVVPTKHSHSEPCLALGVYIFSSGVFYF